MFSKKGYWPTVFFVCLLGGVTLFYFSVIRWFFLDIFLAVILANLFFARFSFFRSKFKLNGTLSSILTVVLAILVIILPIYLIGVVFTNQAGHVVLRFQEYWPEFQAEFVSATWMEKLPFWNQIGVHFQDLEIQDKLSGTVSGGMKFLWQLAQKAIVNLNLVVFHSIIILILMHYFLIDGQQLMARIQYYIPLRNKDENEFIMEFDKIIRATLIGTLMIGVIEGLVGFSLFLVFGIGSPFFWAVLMMVLSVIPIVGTIFVYVPWGIVLILTTSTFHGVAFMVLGLVATNVIQNVIKPKLVGARGGLHPGIFLISTLGGILSFGLVGFLIGPVLGSVFVVVWDQFGRKFEGELKRWNR